MRNYNKIITIDNVNTITITIIIIIIIGKQAANWTLNSWIPYFVI